MSVWNDIGSMESAIEHSFPGLKDFPKGLRVLVVDSDEEALLDAKLKLEACDYIVTMFSSGHEAMIAVEESGADFHIAVVEKEEATDGLKLVSAISTRLPTILISKSKNMSTMMEGIAAGASEVLAKPLKTDQLRSIWQHVFRKALCVRGAASQATSVAEASEDTCTSVRLLAVQSAQPPSSSSCMISVHEYNEDDGPFDPRTTSCESSSGAFNGSEIERQEEHGEEMDTDQYRTLDCNMFLLSSPLPPPSPHNEEASSGSRPDLTIGCSSLAAGNTSHSKAEAHERDPPREECSIHSTTVDVKSEQDYVESFCLSECIFEKSVDHSDDPNVSCDELEFDCHLEDITLSNDLADELIPRLELDSAMLDELNSSDESLVMSFDCLDDLVTKRSAHQPIMLQEACDEEALLLAEVAKAEACITAADSDIMGTHIARSGSSVSILTSCTTSSSTIRTDLDRKMVDPSCIDSDHSSGRRSTKGAGHSKKKTKVDWTPELHRQFVQAVEQLGVDKAIPSKILEVMGTEGLTRHNIASHLQKYRSHKKHHTKASREPDKAARNQGQQMDSSPGISTTMLPQQGGHPPPSVAQGCLQQPLSAGHYHVQVAAVARGSNNSSPGAFAYPVTPALPGLHVWGHPSLNYDQFWPIKSKADGNAIVWHPPPAPPSVCLGHPTHFYPQPVLRLPLMPLRASSHSANVQADKVSCWHPTKEAVDAAISEVLKNPFTPLPLGLKPPAWDSVVSELQRQGITTGLSTAIS